ncbi:hypothetical protein AACH06_03875 [Ideonella sp. DXS29W]|uniref:N-acetyltransferase n=1 Tax=Ideonella lacteola TaxID=2984193 RepID=A0ABU9BJ13_9BURK
MKIVAGADLGVMYAEELRAYPPQVLKQMKLPEMTSGEAIFKRCYAGCPSIGFEVDGRAVGGCLMEENKMHLAVHPDFHGVWTLQIAEVFDWVFSHSDPAIGRIYAGNRPALRLAHHIGGEVLGREHCPATGLDFMHIEFTSERMVWRRSSRHRDRRARRALTPRTAGLEISAAV